MTDMYKGRKMSTIVAFGHRSAVGKDTSVKFLSTLLSTKGKKVQHRSFAAPLKEVCHTLYGWAGLKAGIHYENHREDRDIKIPFLNMTPVEIWVEVGNKLRDVYERTWIDLTLRTPAKADFLFISDLRYENEVTAIQELGGLCLKVNNSRAPIRDTSADNALQGFAYWHGHVFNEMSLNDLNTAMGELANDLLNGTTEKGKVYGSPGL
jgi:hypothetical protein